MLDLSYKITDVRGSNPTYGVKESIGQITVVEYNLYFNNKKIAECHYNDTTIPAKELLNQFIERYILKNEYELKRIMGFLDKNLPEDEFFTELCEDDFYEGIEHDLRNPDILENFQVKEFGRELNFTYLSFLKKHENLLSMYYHTI